MISASPSDVSSVAVGAEAVVQVDGPASVCCQGVLVPMPVKERNKAMEMIAIDIERETVWTLYFCLYLCR